MFLPIGDSPNLPKTPWLTWALIVVNVVIHLALLPLESRSADQNDPATRQYLEVLANELGVRETQLRAIDLVAFRYGIRPSNPDLSSALTSMFLHAGWAHLFGNMLFLFIFGDNVEHRLGRFRFLIAYLATGLLATGGDILLRWESGIPSIGASGAISGVLGLYFGWFPHNRVRVWAFLFPFYMGIIEPTARLVLGIYLVVQNLLPALFSAGGGVSHGAHIGGFLAGWAITSISSSSFRRFKPSLAPTDGRPREVEAEHVISRSPLETAAKRWLQAPIRRGSEEEFAKALDLAKSLERAHLLDLALAVYRRILVESSAERIRATAHLGVARMMIRGQGSPTLAYQHLSAAMHARPSPLEIEEAYELAARLESLTTSLPRRLFR